MNEAAPVDWEHGEFPEVMDLEFARGWLKAVVLPYVTAASDAARASRLLADHQGVSPHSDARTKAIHQRLLRAAMDAEHHAGLAQAEYDRLNELADHGEWAQAVAELVVRASDAGLHFATMTGYLRPPGASDTIEA